MLISESYLESQRKLHANPSYGISGKKYAEKVLKLADRLNTRDILDYGCGKKTLQEVLGFKIRNYDPATSDNDRGPADLVVCTDVLEHIEPECLDDVLKDISRCTRTMAYFVIVNVPSKKVLDDGRNAHLIQKDVEWWIGRIEKFLSITAVQVWEKGCEIFCNMQKRTQVRTACYDLAQQPTTFDFCTFLVIAKTLGAQRIIFALDGGLKEKDYSEKESIQRLENILLPSCDLIGLPYSFGKNEGIHYSHVISNVFNLYRMNGKIEKFPSANSREDYVTVTYRNSRKPARNSNVPEWEKFIRWCDRRIIVVPDYADAPIALEDRFALYSKAYMNLMVMGGPCLLCHYSDAPIIDIKNVDCHEEFLGNAKMHGEGLNYQYPWSNKDQVVVWKDDTFENIKEAYLEVENNLNY